MNNKNIEDARTYISLVRKFIVPGMHKVYTSDKREIDLDNLSDADALFCAKEFRGWEVEAARRGAKDRKGRLS